MSDTPIPDFYVEHVRLSPTGLVGTLTFSVTEPPREPKTGEPFPLRENVRVRANLTILKAFAILIRHDLKAMEAEAQQLIPVDPAVLKQFKMKSAADW